MRQINVLPRLMERLTAQTGQVLNIVKAANAAGIEPRSGDNYARLLEALFLIRRLPAWGRTLRSRTAHSPKLHVVDSGLAAYLLGITPERLARRNPSALAEFGHLFETFVVGELLKQASWRDDVRELGHWRTHDGEEVDLNPPGFGRGSGYRIPTSWSGCRAPAFEWVTAIGRRLVQAGADLIGDAGTSLRRVDTLRERRGVGINDPTLTRQTR